MEGCAKRSDGHDAVRVKRVARLLLSARARARAESRPHGTRGVPRDGGARRGGLRRDSALEAVVPRRCRQDARARPSLP